MQFGRLFGQTTIGEFEKGRLIAHGIRNSAGRKKVYLTDVPLR